MSTSSPQLFVLHGWSVDETNASKWQPFIAALADQGISATFLPLPGLSTPLSTAWSLPDYVDWVLKQLPTNKTVAILGHSFGGQIAVRLAARHPDRVSQLILVDASGLRDHSLKAVSKRVVFALLAKIGKIVTKADWARKVLYKLAREQDYYQAPPVMRETMANVVAEEIRNDLSRVQAPTLVIWGEGDRVTPLSFGRIMATSIPQAQLTIIPEARHSPQFTHLDSVVTAVGAFLKSGTKVVPARET